MKAATVRRYGGPEVVAIEELPSPTPGPGEVLVRVEAATVGAPDAAGLSGSPAFARLYFGLTRPKQPVFGNEFAGRVEAVGPGVEGFRGGDRVFGMASGAMGTHAEYVCVPEVLLAFAPASVDAAGAAAVVDATALAFLRDSARLAPGQTILVNGATGAVGSVAIQLAKHFGARVTAVCRTANLEFARELGADDAIDFTRDDFTRSGRHWDVVFDAAGKSSYRRARRVLSPKGLYMTTVPSLGILVRTLLTRRSTGRRGLVSFTGLRPAAARSADLAVTRELVESGALVPVIGGRHPLGGIADAYRQLAAGKRGVVVVTMGS